MKNGGGHFAPKLGGQFELESGGHFKLELGGQYHWNLHMMILLNNWRRLVLYFKKNLFGINQVVYQLLFQGLQTVTNIFYTLANQKLFLLMMILNSMIIKTT